MSRESAKLEPRLSRPDIVSCNRMLRRRSLSEKLSHVQLGNSCLITYSKMLSRRSGISECLIATPYLRYIRARKARAHAGYNARLHRRSALAQDRVSFEKKSP